MIAKAKFDLALEKMKREMEVAKAKEELAEVEKKAIETFRALTDFMTEKAWVMAALNMSKKFYVDYHLFSKEAFHEGFKLG